MFADACFLQQDSSPGTPIFVFLAPGVDLAAAVETLGRKLGFTAAAGKYTSVSLGQVRHRCRPVHLLRLVVSTGTRRKRVLLTGAAIPNYMVSLSKYREL